MRGMWGVCGRWGGVEWGVWKGWGWWVGGWGVSDLLPAPAGAAPQATMTGRPRLVWLSTCRRRA